MKLEPIITSCADIDLYKITMGQIMWHKHSNLMGTYIFNCRNDNITFTQEMLKEINEQVNHLCTLRFTDEELEYLSSLPYIKSDYVEFLRLWHPLREYVKIWLYNGKLNIEINGPLYSAMQFEIYLLAIVNEVYFRMKYNYSELLESATNRLYSKIADFKDGKYSFNFVEFGTRRRLSREWQEYMFEKLFETGYCTGTSNVYLAMKYECKPVGTFAHEYVQMFQGIPKNALSRTNDIALWEWYQEYHGDLGIALTDTLGTDLFLLDFDIFFADVYTGVRHDSGDPYQWGEKIISHYEKLGISPKEKTLLFSDSLNFKKAQDIWNHFHDRTNVSFGIGTYLSNDTDVDPLNIVIKLQYVNGKPVAKLSDDLGKTMCQNKDYVDYLKSKIKERLEEEKENN